MPHPATLIPLFTLPDDAARHDLPKLPLAVIGAGFSGTLAAVQLLNNVAPDQPVLLCERGDRFARGVAYGTQESDHLLNVRAANMSALAQDRAHFENWIADNADLARGHVHETHSGLFASRWLYGRYLHSVLNHCLRENAGTARLRLLPDDVIDIEPGKAGFTLKCASGQAIEVAGVVLAIGNLPPHEDKSPRICGNPWGDKALTPPDPASDLPVVIVGTGLTMVDLILSLRRRGYRGKILAMSRGGLLARAHRPVQPWPTPDFTVAERQSMAGLTRALRREIAKAAEQTIDWRSVIDSLRPITQQIWLQLPATERSRFMRHARRFWDVHRHRMAPPNGDTIDQLIADGTLRVAAGRVIGLKADDDSVEVTWRPRGAAQPQTLRAQRVIKAAGLENLARSTDPLVQSLLARGLARIDCHGSGFDVTPDLNMIAKDGMAQQRLWSLGPIVRGVFWECIAVPDVRVQAQFLAHHVATDLRQSATSWAFSI